MSTGSSSLLPIIENCDGCGACCMHIPGNQIMEGMRDTGDHREFEIGGEGCREARIYQCIDSYAAREEEPV
jgi:MinD superfamily P-loop ATPase